MRRKSQLTLRKLVNAGAVGNVAMYHAGIERTDPTWAKTTEYAQREFREASTQTIAALIRKAKTAREKAKAIGRIQLNGRRIKT